MQPTTSTRSQPGIRLYLVRHGETQCNAQGLIRGCMDMPLNEIGHRQAASLGRMRCWRPLNRVISGPLMRARQTAEPIARRAGLDYEVDEAFLDRDYGPWTGRPRASVNLRYGHVDDAPNIEPFARFSERLWRALSRIVAEANTGDNVVLVTHKAVNRALLSCLFPSYANQFRRINQRTGCWNLCQFDGQRWSLGRVDVLPPGREDRGEPSLEDGWRQEDSTARAGRREILPYNVPIIG